MRGRRSAFPAPGWGLGDFFRDTTIRTTFLLSDARLADFWESLTVTRITGTQGNDNLLGTPR